MKSIENDILDSVELNGLTQDQINKMSHFEIKEFQRTQSDDKITTENKSFEFALVSLVFFALVAAFLVANPILSIYVAIAPVLVALVFAFKANKSHNNIQMEKISRTMLESFYEDNEL
jgi:Na+/H+ antiporter NhaD/arsenite permease-like protein